MMLAATKPLRGIRSTEVILMLQSLLQVHQERMENLFRNPVKMVMTAKNQNNVTKNRVD